MNAKFEKWFREHAAYSESYDDARMAWNESIQSLEVTQELVEIARTAMNKHKWADGLTAEENVANEVSCALVAVLSALKEQAK